MVGATTSAPDQVWLSEMDKSDQGMIFLAFAVLKPHLQYEAGPCAGDAHQLAHLNLKSGPGQRSGVVHSGTVGIACASGACYRAAIERSTEPVAYGNSDIITETVGMATPPQQLRGLTAAITRIVCVSSHPLGLHVVVLNHSIPTHTWLGCT